MEDNQDHLQHTDFNTSRHESIRNSSLIREFTKRASDMNDKTSFLNPEELSRSRPNIFGPLKNSRNMADLMSNYQRLSAMKTQAYETQRQMESQLNDKYQEQPRETHPWTNASAISMRRRPVEIFGPSPIPHGPQHNQIESRLPSCQPKEINENVAENVENQTIEDFRGVQGGRSRLDMALSQFNPTDRDFAGSIRHHNYRGISNFKSPVRYGRMADTEDVYAAKDQRFDRFEGHQEETNDDCMKMLRKMHDVLGVYIKKDENKYSQLSPMKGSRGQSPLQELTSGANQVRNFGHELCIPENQQPLNNRSNCQFVKDLVNQNLKSDQDHQNDYCQSQSFKDCFKSNVELNDQQNRMDLREVADCENQDPQQYYQHSHVKRNQLKLAKFKERNSFMDLKSENEPRQVGQAQESEAKALHLMTRKFYQEAGMYLKRHNTSKRAKRTLDEDVYGFPQNCSKRRDFPSSFQTPPEKTVRGEKKNGGILADNCIKTPSFSEGRADMCKTTAAKSYEQVVSTDSNVGNTARVSELALNITKPKPGDNSTRQRPAEQIFDQVKSQPSKSEPSSPSSKFTSNQEDSSFELGAQVKKQEENTRDVFRMDGRGRGKDFDLLNQLKIANNTFRDQDLPNLVAHLSSKNRLRKPTGKKQPKRHIARAIHMIEDTPSQLEERKERSRFHCDECNENFTTGQALGGHMSRVHPGKSSSYARKVNRREERTFDRELLRLAKIEHAKQFGEDAELNRVKIRRFKRIIRNKITKGEYVEGFSGNLLQDHELNDSESE